MTEADLPFSPACVRNQGPILALLQAELAACRTVLELGSGTGQHAVHFASQLAPMTWQPSDRAENLPTIAARVTIARLPNLLAPIELDVTRPPAGLPRVDAVFSANPLHIMAWPQVEQFFQVVGRALRDHPAPATLAVYGPFRYSGEFTSASNAEFDQSLRQRDPASGIRDFEAVDSLARAQGLRLRADHAMPANNQLLVWSTAPDGYQGSSPPA